MGSLSQFKEDVGALLRGHLSAGEGVRGVGLLKTGENTDYFLHNPILRWFFDCGRYRRELPADSPQPMHGSLAA